MIQREVILENCFNCFKLHESFKGHWGYILFVYRKLNDLCQPIEQKLDKKFFSTLFLKISIYNIY